jgi:hypothetical protein
MSPAPTHPIAEPPDDTIALFVHPSTGRPEAAWYRDDQAALEGEYDAQHWYPIGRTDEEPPATWEHLLTELHTWAEVRLVTNWRTIGITPERPPLKR